MSDTIGQDRLPELAAGVYQHYKGDDYLVIGYAHDANNDGRHLVAYVPLYDAPGPRIAVRDVSDFFDTVKTDLGEMPRFRFVRSG